MSMLNDMVDVVDKARADNKLAAITIYVDSVKNFAAALDGLKADVPTFHGFAVTESKFLPEHHYAICERDVAGPRVLKAGRYRADREPIFGKKVRA